MSPRDDRPSSAGPSAATDELVNRRVLGRYRVLRKLAVGGMGVIYLGRSEGAAGFAKPVVIKRIDPKFMHLDEEAEAYFINEAKLLSQMRHPGIVSVVDFGRESDGAYAMVLEYVHGFTLMQWLRFHRAKDERFPAEEAIILARRVLEALEYAHTLRASDGTPRGVVHRDVTPSNVLIDVDGHIKLADFGIASIRSTKERRGTRKLRGKFSYIAPELLTGASASIASDIHSAALMLHELLVGANEFRASAPGTTLQRVATHVPTRVSAARDDTDPSLDGILARALAKDPALRHPSADALAEELRLVQRAPDAEIERRLKQRVRADFEGALPTRLGLEPLEVRAAALNEPRRSDPPPPGPARGGRRSRGFLAAAIMTALLTTGGGAFALFGTPERPMKARARYLVIERDEPTATTEALRTDALSAFAISSPEAAPAAAAPPETVTRPARPTRVMNEEPGLTRAFAFHRRAIQACYRKYRVDGHGGPPISLHFRIDEGGDVQSVALSPARVGSTVLGKCLLAVARNARFGPQDRALRFTIPVTASVSRRDPDLNSAAGPSDR